MAKGSKAKDPNKQNKVLNALRKAYKNLGDPEKPKNIFSDAETFKKADEQFKRSSEKSRKKFVEKFGVEEEIKQNRRWGIQPSKHSTSNRR